MSTAFEKVAAVRRGSRRAAATPRPNFLYILPAALFFGFFALLPLVLVVALSFTTWTGIGDPEAAGMENWSRLFSDEKVLAATRTTLFLTVLSWATQTPLSLLLGVWAAGRQRNRAVLSAVFFLPLLLSSAAIALMFHRFLDPNFGLAADLGPLIGFEDGNIIGTRGGALAAIVFVVGWQFVPFHTLIYQAAARNIPAVLYDAATIDGAGRWQAFRRITLPQLRNTVVTSSTLMIVGSLTFFETILLLTNGGPGIATHVLPFLMYRAGFEGYEFGYAATIATLLVVVGTTLSLLIVRFSGFAKMRSTLEGL
ncbi:carbohydrate ABC transporter permease [Phytomonospora endophytica]|uniref:Xylobiose transport system permease protein n=1 Tax=Phytomonospora endophytica TaxID=714109 RepID=A0A841FLA0_9ACTN|nr:sugar ABC transporter permease [Phytomonospora endophytica]MBB6036936.1 xylobiose transport system permease protein [Phytomonospora endophytica]GIG68033.1 ABC transporter [Phytomonospora endophytica]